MMKFDFDLDKLKATGKEYMEKGADLANDLAERAVRETRILNDQNKLAKAQRELGALVYSLAKRGESNQPLLDKYIDAISALEQEIDQLRAMDQAAPAAEEPVYMDLDAQEPAASAQQEPAPEQPAAEGHFCPQCGAKVPEDALFCNHCGSQL